MFYLYLHFLFCVGVRVIGHCSHLHSYPLCNVCPCPDNLLRSAPVLLKFSFKGISASSAPSDWHSQETQYGSPGSWKWENPSLHFSYSWYDVSLQYSIYLWFCSYIFQFYIRILLSNFNETIFKPSWYLFSKYESKNEFFWLKGHILPSSWKTVFWESDKYKVSENVFL